jgi:signal peptidase II
VKLNRLGRFLLSATLVLLCVAADRVTKDLAQHTLSQTEPRSLLGGILILTYAENEGAFLGLGANLPAPARFALSVLANGAMIAWGLVTIVRTDDIGIARPISVALLLGGGIGNLIDRLQQGGAVSDFMVLRLGPLQTGVFNVADVAITGGALAIAALAACEGKHLAQQQAGQGTEEDSEPVVHQVTGKRRNGTRL